MKKVLLTGGGTLGSVTPLIAIKESLEKQYNEYEFLFVGTYSGVEKDFVSKEYGMRYIGIASGKLRRYLSIQNLLDPFNIAKGFFQSWKLLRQEQPDIVITAGSFVSVPLVIAAKLQRIPILVHQLDIRIGLANKIMAAMAQMITITFADHLQNFSDKKVRLVGSPVREELFSGQAKKAQDIFGIHNDLATILVLGGGIGSVNINKLLEKSSKKITEFCNVIHITGKGKQGNLKDFDGVQGVYRVREFIGKEYSHALSLATVVMTRAGLATLAELLALGKVIITIPIKNHQQEDNAKYLERKGAAIYIDEESCNAEQLGILLKNLLFDTTMQKRLAEAAEGLGYKQSAHIVAKLIHTEILAQ